MTTTIAHSAAFGETSGSPTKAFDFYTAAALKERKDFGRGAIVTGCVAIIVGFAMNKTRGSFDMLLSIFCVGVLASLCLSTFTGFIRSADRAAQAREKDAKLEQQLRSDFRISQSVLLASEREALESYLADNYPELLGKLKAAV